MADNVLKIKTKKGGNCIHSPVRRLLPLTEAANYLGRSVDSLRELIYAREFKILQRGNGKIWLDIRDLDAWIEANKRYA